MSQPVSPAAPPGSLPVRALRMQHGERSGRDELLAEETPVALVYNGISHAVMMATPLDLEDFALGFSLTEGILERPGELLDCEISEIAGGVSVALQITEARFQGLKERRRSLTGRTGCGLCGQDTLAQAMRAIPRLAEPGSIQVDEIQAAMQALVQAQCLNAATGAVHAAGWWRQGQLVVREDVGRHNALDKLIGASAKQPARDGVVVISSRASYEMVHKAAAAGFSILAAVSAPTALAMQLADEAGLCLLGFVREGRLTAYTHAHRICN